MASKIYLLCLFFFSFTALADECLDVFSSAVESGNEYAFSNIPQNKGTSALTIKKALKSGTHYFDDTSLNNTSLELKITNGPVFIYINDFTITNTDLNKDGEPEDLIIIVNGDLDINAVFNAVTINAIIYVTGKTSIDLFFGSLNFNGALRTIGGVGGFSLGRFNVNYDQTSIEHTDFGGLCTEASTSNCPELSSYAGSIFINELQSDEAWLEIFSGDLSGAAPLSMNGWKIKANGQGNKDFEENVCSGTCSIDSNDFIVMASDAGESSIAAAISDGVLVNNDNFFVNSSVEFHPTLQEVLLLDQDDKLIHYLTYTNNGNAGNGWQWLDCLTEQPDYSTQLMNPGNDKHICSEPDGRYDDADWTNSCNGPTPGESNDGASVDHYEIIITNNSTSLCNSENVIIKACQSDDYPCAQVFDEELAANVVTTINGGISTIDSSLFTGSKTVSVSQASEANVLFSLSDLSPSKDVVCLDSLGNVLANCQIAFTSDPSFVVSNISGPSCEAINFNITAYEFDELSQQCQQLTGTDVLNLSFQYATPSSGSRSLNTEYGGAAQVIKNTGKASYNLDLSAGDVTLSYPDSGQLILTVSDPEGVISSATANALFIPAYLDVSTVSSGPIIAGDDFSFTVSAYCSDGTLTPNYQAGNLQITSQRTAGNQDGAFEYSSGNQISVLSSQSTIDIGNVSTVFSSASYGEYGEFDIAFSDSNYFSQSISLDWSNHTTRFGKFIASYLSLDKQALPWATFEYHDIGFNYVGKRFGYFGAQAENGDFTLANPPTIRLKAFNSNDEQMHNYQLSSLTLDPGNLSASDITYAHGVNAVLTKGAFAAELDVGNNIIDGQFIYTFNNSDYFTYNKTSASSEPFDSALVLSILANGFIDQDSRSNNQQFDLDFSLSGLSVEQRYGRFIAHDENASAGGSVNARFYMQYWDNGWQINTLDNTSSLSQIDFSTVPARSSLNYNSGFVVPLDDGRDANTSEVTSIWPTVFASGDSQLVLTESGLDIGTIRFVWPSSMPIWLQADWGSGSLAPPPSTLINFQLKSGNERIISWREID